MQEHMNSMYINLISFRMNSMYINLISFQVSILTNMTKWLTSVVREAWIQGHRREMKQST